MDSEVCNPRDSERERARQARTRRETPQASEQTMPLFDRPIKKEHNDNISQRAKSILGSFPQVSQTVYQYGNQLIGAQTLPGTPVTNKPPVKFDDNNKTPIPNGLIGPNKIASPQSKEKKKTVVDLGKLSSVSSISSGSGGSSKLEDRHNKRHEKKQHSSADNKRHRSTSREYHSDKEKAVSKHSEHRSSSHSRQRPSDSKHKSENGTVKPVKSADEQSLTSVKSESVSPSKTADVDKPEKKCTNPEKPNKSTDSAMMKPPSNLPKNGIVNGRIRDLSVVAAAGIRSMHDALPKLSIQTTHVKASDGQKPKIEHVLEEMIMPSPLTGIQTPRKENAFPFPLSKRVPTMSLSNHGGGGHRLARSSSKDAKSETSDRGLEHDLQLSEDSESETEDVQVNVKDRIQSKGDKHMSSTGAKMSPTMTSGSGSGSGSGSSSESDSNSESEVSSSSDEEEEPEPEKMPQQTKSQQQEESPKPKWSLQDHMPTKTESPICSVRPNQDISNKTSNDNIIDQSNEILMEQILGDYFDNTNLDLPDDIENTDPVLDDQESYLDAAITDIIEETVEYPQTDAFIEQHTTISQSKASSESLQVRKDGKVTGQECKVRKGYSKVKQDVEVKLEKLKTEKVHKSNKNSSSSTSAKINHKQTEEKKELTKSAGSAGSAQPSHNVKRKHSVKKHVSDKLVMNVSSKSNSNDKTVKSKSSSSKSTLSSMKSTLSLGQHSSSKHQQNSKVIQDTKPKQAKPRNNSSNTQKKPNSTKPKSAAFVDVESDLSSSSSSSSSGGSSESSSESEDEDDRLDLSASTNSSMSIDVEGHTSPEVDVEGITPPRQVDSTPKRTPKHNNHTPKATYHGAMPFRQDCDGKHSLTINVDNDRSHSNSKSVVVENVIDSMTEMSPPDPLLSPIPEKQPITYDCHGKPSIMVKFNINFMGGIQSLEELLSVNSKIEVSNLTKIKTEPVYPMNVSSPAMAKKLQKTCHMPSGLSEVKLKADENHNDSKTDLLTQIKKESQASLAKFTKRKINSSDNGGKSSDTVKKLKMSSSHVKSSKSMVMHSEASDKKDKTCNKDDKEWARKHEYRPEHVRRGSTDSNASRRSDRSNCSSHKHSNKKSNTSSQNTDHSKTNGYHKRRNGEWEREASDTSETKKIRPAPIVVDLHKPYDYYKHQATKLKHEADETKDSTQKYIKYLEAALYFVLGARVLERDRVKEIAMIFSLYKETCNLLRHTCAKQQKVSSNEKDPEVVKAERKLAVLGLQIQSLLHVKLYRMKRHDAINKKKIIDEYNKTHQPTKSSHQAQAPSPYQTGWTNRSTGTPSPASPAPSPAGSIGSIGSHGSQGSCNNDWISSSKSTNGSAVSGSNSGVNANMSSPGAVVTNIPGQIHSATQTYIYLTNFLVQSHEMWDQAEMQKIEYREFFTALESCCPPLTFHSTLEDLVSYVQTAIRSIREIMS